MIASKPRHFLLPALLWLASTLPAAAQPTFASPGRYQPTAEERAEIQKKLELLKTQLGDMPSSTRPDDVVADVLIFQKAGTRALEHDELFEKKDVATVLTVLDWGVERARTRLQNLPFPWTIGRGSIARGFTSKIDGSIQPYAVIVPESLVVNREKRARLDVVLHGRDQTISEARFIARFDHKPSPKNPEADAQDKITLHVFGRGNNAYRWAGETDVFEAIEAVKRNYPIDDRRVVLRGFSMGGAGAWHLSLHHPSSWSSVEAGAGFTETEHYANLTDTPVYEEKALRIYDAVDYALNAYDVPIVGYGGEVDPQLQASTNIVEALKSLGFTLKTDGLVTRGEGIDFLRLVGAQMGHKVDPASAKIMKAFHDEHAIKGVNLDSKHIRFATYTAKYGKAGWLAIEQLREHYARAEVDAEIQGDKLIIHKAENVALLAVDRHVGETITLGGESFPLESAVKGLLPNVYFRRVGEGWKALDYRQSRAFEEGVDPVKRRGLQGPIDDAFTAPFVCVRGTGTPWSQAIGRWSTSRLDEFLKDWSTWMRGDARVIDDSAVNADETERANLILFGDPGSNAVIAKILKDLPMLTWTRAEVRLGGETYTAADHVPVLIAPNPLNPRRYVVLNSGHTFGADAFVNTNAMLYPRLGDYAVFRTDGRNAALKASGYFDEGWSLHAK